MNQFSDVESQHSSDLESDEDFTLTPEKHVFNASMNNLSNTWTPLKYRLNKSFDDCAKKTQQQAVRKAMKAFDAVLTNIADKYLGNCQVF